MGLTPKHRIPAPKLNWEELDRTLKACIDTSNHDNPYVTLDLDNYSMDPNEIISEIKNNGYSVEFGTKKNIINVR